MLGLGTVFGLICGCCHTNSLKLIDGGRQSVLPSGAQQQPLSLPTCEQEDVWFLDPLGIAIQVIVGFPFLAARHI
jgi:hypothetical protein